MAIKESHDVSVRLSSWHVVGWLYFVYESVPFATFDSDSQSAVGINDHPNAFVALVKCDHALAVDAGKNVGTQLKLRPPCEYRGCLFEGIGRHWYSFAEMPPVRQFAETHQLFSERVSGRLFGSNREQHSRRACLDNHIVISRSCSQTLRRFYRW